MALNDLTDNYCVYGMAVSDFGLIVIDATNPIGLSTRGLVWQVPVIWFDYGTAQGITTTWTPVTLGIFGEN